MAAVFDGFFKDLTRALIGRGVTGPLVAGGETAGAAVLGLGAGDPEIGTAIRGLAGQRSAVLLAPHGAVVAGMDLDTAVFAMEELEENAKLAMLTRGLQPGTLDADQVAAVRRRFPT